MTEEHKKKISEALKGRHLSEEHKKKVGEHNARFWFGKKRVFSKEWREKISKAQLGKKGIPRTEEWKKKIGLANSKKHPSEEARRKMSEAHKGNKNNWQGGITPLHSQIRHCFKYRQWRDDIFTRDEFTCMECGDDRGHNLNAHHTIKTFSQILRGNNIKTLEDALACDEFWNINNGITLCEDCHKKTDTYLRGQLHARR
jgi:hypothetical protein